MASTETSSGRLTGFDSVGQDSTLLIQKEAPAFDAFPVVKHCPICKKESWLLILSSSKPVVVNSPALCFALTLSNPLRPCSDAPRKLLRLNTTLSSPSTMSA